MEQEGQEMQIQVMRKADDRQRLTHKYQVVKFIVQKYRRRTSTANGVNTKIYFSRNRRTLRTWQSTVGASLSRPSNAENAARCTVCMNLLHLASDVSPG